MTTHLSVAVSMLIALAQAQPPASPPPQPQVFGIQQRGAPRDAVPNAKGTAILRGRILNIEGRPLRRVQIRLSGENIPEGRTASTNGLGKWEVRELPAGRFNLFATRAGYLQAQFGQKRFGEPGRPIEIADAQTLENIDLTLTHNGVISGHVYDEAGEPLAGANVMPLQMRFFNGRKRLTPTRGNTSTDDSGQYRIGGLEPGDYYVYVASRETWETEPPDVKTMGFMPTMYPAAVSMAEAQRVRVRAGQEVTGIDIPLVPGRAATISGTAVSSQGLPLAGESVGLGVEIRGEQFQSFSGGASTRVGPDGTFAFRNVAPGEYHLTARITPTDRPLEAANVVVNVAGADVEGVSIVTSAAGTVAGRVSIEPGTPFPNPLTRLIVRPLPVDRDTVTSLGSAADNGRVREDGSFELKQIVGASRLTVTPLPEGWAIRQIDQNGRDLASQPFDPQGQTLDGATIVLTNRFPQLTATLHDDKGAPVVDGILVLFPEDGAQWAEDLRMIRTGRPGQSGAITLRAVRPGLYLAAAVPTATNSQLNDPDFLESLRAQAKRITLAEGEPAHADVVVKAPGG
jgi:protocatechuate 3,4-dioxygenase beta subunit